MKTSQHDPEAVGGVQIHRNTRMCVPYFEHSNIHIGSVDGGYKYILVPERKLIFMEGRAAPQHCAPVAAALAETPNFRFHLY